MERLDNIQQLLEQFKDILVKANVEQSSHQDSEYIKNMLSNELLKFNAFGQWQLVKAFDDKDIKRSFKNTPQNMYRKYGDRSAITRAYQDKQARAMHAESLRTAKRGLHDFNDKEIEHIVRTTHPDHEESFIQDQITKLKEKRDKMRQLKNKTNSLPNRLKSAS